MELAKEKIVATFLLGDLSASKQFMFFTSKGNIKKTLLDKFITSYSKLSALKLKENDKLIDIKLIEKERQEAFIKVITKEGLEFSVEEPKLKSVERNVIGTQLFNLTAGDEVMKIEYTKDYDYKEFYLSLNAKGVIKISSRRTNTLLSTYTKSTSTLLIFTQNGLVHKLPSYMVQNINKKSTCINNFLDNYNANDKIAQIISVDNFSEEISLYFFSKKGFTKRTKLKELEGDFYSTLVYKLKTEEDKLMFVKINDDKVDKDVIIVTKKAMCIRFNVNTINFMGKGASGVTGISLKDNDEVIFVNLIDEKTAEGSNDINDDNISLLISSFGGGNKDIKLNDINVQNRAGRGKNLTSSLLDDYIENVTLK